MVMANSNMSRVDENSQKVSEISSKRFFKFSGILRAVP